MEERKDRKRKVHGGKEKIQRVTGEETKGKKGRRGRGTKEIEEGS